jgi:uncharacterized protein YutE (UPF0331/DUF86 family)
VTRDVLVRKLARLKGFLDDRRPHRGRRADDLEEDPYVVERLLELVVQVSVDILNHELAERGVLPESYRDSFLEAGKRGLIPTVLAGDLALSAGLRNVLVHAYEEIDYEIVAASIDRALDDLTRFVDVYATRLDDESS